MVDGELRKGSAEEFLGLLDGGMSRFLEDSRVRFERPYDPFYSVSDKRASRKPHSLGRIPQPPPVRIHVISNPTDVSLNTR